MSHSGGWEGGREGGRGQKGFVGTSCGGGGGFIGCPLVVPCCVVAF